MTLSVTLHALLFLWIATHKAPGIEADPITEITLLTPGDLAAAAAAAAAAAPAPRAEREPGIAGRSVPKDVRFQRPSRDADIALDPQQSGITDQLSARLAAITRAERPMASGTGTGVVPASLFGTGPATVSGTGTGGVAPAQLNRGGALGGTGALPLARGGGTGAPASLAPAGISNAKNAASAPAQVGDATARRTVAGASLAGPIADRPVLRTVVPDYPDWAKREAVEGSVTLYFVVRPDGGVKENVVIQKTAGFGDFDENARLAIRSWRFEPLRGGRTGEQWGTITFHFRLRDAG
jgi:TonB family protein